MSFPFIDEIKLKFQNELEGLDRESALDGIIYGIVCKRIKNGESNKGFISISDKNQNNLCFSNPLRNKNNFIQMKNIVNISFEKKSENLKDYKIDVGEEFIQINVNQQTYDFSFANKNILLLFIKGLITLFSERKKTECENLLEKNINKLIIKMENI